VIVYETTNGNPIRRILGEAAQNGPMFLVQKTNPVTVSGVRST
jgi:hypothetical protein